MRLFCFLFLMIAINNPVLANSVAIQTDDKEITISTEVIDPVSENSTPLSAYPEGKKKHEFKQIRAALQRALIRADVQPNLSNTNLQLKLIDIPFFYYSQEQNKTFNAFFPDMKKESSVWKYYDYPWVKASLRLEKNKAPSGVITILIAPFAQLRDLHLQANNDNLTLPFTSPHKIKNFSINHDVYKEVINTYEKEFLNSSLSRTQENFQNIFGKSDTDKQVLANLCAISWQSTLGPFEMEVINKIQQCLSQARPYYLNIYEDIFFNILSGKAVSKEYKYSNHDYNCFKKP